jgi:hypothetical protein
VSFLRLYGKNRYGNGPLGNPSKGKGQAAHLVGFDIHEGIYIILSLKERYA